MTIIEITEDKLEGLCENAEKMLRYGGKVMSCLDELKRGKYGERNRMPDYRGRGGRGGMREHEDYDDMRHREGWEREGRDYRDYDEEY